MGSSGKGSTSTTGSPSPYAQSDLNSIMSLARQDQKLPFQGTQLQTAPINQQQYQGIGGVNNYANYAQPGISTAANWINQAAQPISANQINQYMSPYTQDVINATQAQFNNQNQQQMQGVKGNAISQGALGGNREAIAEAETANQQQLAQAPVIAGLENQGYQTGLNTALTEQQNLANSAYGLTNVATAGQNAGLTGANAQIGAGTLEQQNQQQAYGNLWNYQQAQAAYPWQQLAALAPVYTGVASAEGGTTVGTPPAPSAISQAAGAGTLATGLFGSTGAVPYMNSSSPASAPTTAYRGGAIKGYDDGGGVEDYIPIPNVVRGNGIPKPAPSASGSGSGKGSLSGLGNIAGGSGIMGGLGNAFNAGMSSFGEAFPEAGAAVADALPLLALRRGGHVHGYDDGGAVLPSPYSTQSNGISPTPYGGHNSYIPQIQVPRGQGIPKASQPHQDNMQQQMQQIKSLTDGLMGKPSNDLTPIASGTTAPPPPSAELEDSEHDPEYAQWRGGGIHGYADGGSPIDKKPDPMFNYGNDAYDSNNAILPDGSAGILPNNDQSWIDNSPSSGVIDQPLRPIDRINNTFGDLPPTPYPKDQQKFRSAFLDRRPDSYGNDAPPDLNDIPVTHAPAQAPTLPPARFIDTSPPRPPDGVGEYVNYDLPHSSQPTNGISAYTPPEKTAKPSGIFSGINLSKDSKLWPSLISAGLGMMASRSPYAAVGIGEGGQQGLNTYQQLDTQEKKEKLSRDQIDQRAKEFSKRMDMESKKLSLEAMKPQHLRTTPEGEQIFGVPNPLGGYIDPITRKPVTMSNPNENLAPTGSAQIIPADYKEKVAQLPPELRGPEPIRNEDYLSSIDSKDAATVKGLVDYQVNPMSLSVKGGHREKLIGEALSYDPTYDQTLYPAKQKGVNEFYAGGPQSPAGIMTNGNTALLHLRDMSDAIEKFKGEADKSSNPASWIGGSGIPYLSHWANSLYNNGLSGTGNPASVALNEFQQARQRFTEEVTKFYAGGQGTQQEREHALAILDSAKSLPELRSAIAEDARLMKDKVSQLQNRLMQNMGPLAWRNALIRDPNGVLLYKNSQEALKTVEGRARGESDSFVSTAPASGDRKSGTIYKTPSGNMKWTGTGWVKP